MGVDVCFCFYVYVYRYIRGYILFVAEVYLYVFVIPSWIQDLAQ